MARAHLTNIRPDKDHPARHRWGSKKNRKTEEELGGQHQRVDRPGILTDTKGDRRQAEVETADCEVIGGVPTTLRDKELMMMMMMMMMNIRSLNWLQDSVNCIFTFKIRNIIFSHCFTSNRQRWTENVYQPLHAKIVAQLHGPRHKDMLLTRSMMYEAYLEHRNRKKDVFLDEFVDTPIGYRYVQPDRLWLHVGFTPCD